MASNYTENFALCQWEATDQVLREEFNEDNQKIDLALKNQAGSISSLNSKLAGKANTGTVNSLSAKLDQEIQNRKDADTAEANARSNAVAELTAALALKGNCQICYMAYVGDGAASRTITFSGRPLLVLIQGGNLICRGIYGNQYLMNRTNGEGGKNCAATWADNSLTWACDAIYGANSKGGTYYLVALMAADE